MASIGLALVQGQKNAQDMATGQLRAMADMAKSAVEADKLHEYFDPINRADRASALEEKGAIMVGQDQLKKYAPLLQKDLGLGGTKMFEDMGKEVVKYDNGTYRVFDKETGIDTKYGSAEELAAAGVRGVSGTAQTIAKYAEGRAAAKQAMDEKAREKQQEYAAMYDNLKRYEFASNERRTDRMARADEYGAGVGAGAKIQSAYIETAPAQLKAQLESQRVFDALNGITHNEKGEIESIGGKPIAMLSPEERQKVADVIERDRQAMGFGVKKGIPMISATPGRAAKEGLKIEYIEPKQVAPAAVAPSYRAPVAAPGTPGGLPMNNFNTMPKDTRSLGEVLNQAIANRRAGVQYDYTPAAE